MWDPASLLDAPTWSLPLEKGLWQPQGWGGQAPEALEGSMAPPFPLHPCLLEPPLRCQGLQTQA